MQPTVSQTANADLTDEQLVARVLQGEQLLFELLIRRNNPHVYRVVRSIIRDEAEVEDVMQSAFLRAYASLSSFKGNARFSTWLRQIAYNEALGRLRSAKRHPAMRLVDAEEQHMSPVHSTPTPENSAARSELRSLLERAADELPEIYRTTFILRDVDGVDTADAAEILGVTDDVVKTRLSRARAMLRVRIEELVGAAASEAFGFHAVRCDRIVRGVMSQLSAPA
jgi:RNA polymerase sigma-70 factor (ECF subfamily)